MFIEKNKSPVIFHMTRAQKSLKPKIASPFSCNIKMIQNVYARRQFGMTCFPAEL